MSELLLGNSHSEKLITSDHSHIQIEVLGPYILIKFPDGKFVGIGRSPHQNLEETLVQIENIIGSCQSKHQSQLETMQALYEQVPSEYSIITFRES